MIEPLIEKYQLKTLLEKLTENLKGIYPVTYQELRGRRRQELFRYALGDERHWVGMEALFEASADVGLQPEFRYNRRRTAKYTVVHAGSLVLTASRVRHPNENPRISCFRNSLAILNRPTLFPPRHHSVEQEHFAVILHGCFDQDPKHLGFLRMVFPGRNMRPLASLDILRYLAKPSVKLETEEERIKRTRVPRLRRIKKIQEE